MKYFLTLLHCPFLETLKKLDTLVYSNLSSLFYTLPYSEIFGTCDTLKDSETLQILNTFNLLELIAVFNIPTIPYITSYVKIK